MSRGAQLNIDTLTLKLPSGMGQRADAIAREAVRQLSRLPVTRDIRLDTLSVPNVRVHGGEANGVIARRIARAIHTQIGTVPSSSDTAITNRPLVGGHGD